MTMSQVSVTSLLLRSFVDVTRLESLIGKRTVVLAIWTVWRHDRTFLSLDKLRLVVRSCTCTVWLPTLGSAYVCVVFCKLAICWPIGAPRSTYFGTRRKGTNMRRLSCLLVQREREVGKQLKRCRLLGCFFVCTIAFDSLSALQFIEWNTEQFVSK